MTGLTSTIPWDVVAISRDGSTQSASFVEEPRECTAPIGGITITGQKAALLARLKHWIHTLE